MLSTTMDERIRGPARAGRDRTVTDEERMRHLLALLEGERETDRQSISRLEALVERQGRLLEACRRRLGRAVFESLRDQVDLT